jgi:hypothetical protein
MGFMQDELKKKTAEGSRLDVCVHRTTYGSSGFRTGGDGIATSEPPPVGTRVGGGGRVTEATTGSYSVEYPDNSTPGWSRATSGSETTVTQEFTATDTGTETRRGGAGAYQAAQGPTVGQQLPDGGVVTAVGDHTVTISYPNGTPTGPIEVPWVDTTVIRETGPTTDGASDFFFGSLAVGDVLDSGPGFGLDDVDHEVEELSQHKHKFSVTPLKPGNRFNSIRMPQSFNMRNVKNAGPANCSVAIVMVDGGGKVTLRVDLAKGQSVSEIHVPAEGATLEVSVASNCHDQRKLVVTWTEDDTFG